MNTLNLDLAKSMTGRTEQEILDAVERLGTYDLVEIASHLLEVPSCPGNRYLPPPPKIDDGLTPEVRAKLAEARRIVDLMNKREEKPISSEVQKSVKIEELPSEGLPALVGADDQQSVEVPMLSVQESLQTQQESPSQTS